jgi:hypothetical protein
LDSRVLGSEPHPVNLVNPVYLFVRRSERQFHPEAIDQESPLVGGFFDDFAGGFAGVMAGAACNVAGPVASIEAWC